MMAPRIIRPSRVQPVGGKKKQPSSTGGTVVQRTVIDGVPISDSEAKRFGVNAFKPLDSKSLQAIKDDRDAQRIADTAGTTLFPSTPPITSSAGSGGGTDTSGGGADAGYGKVLADYVRRSMGNIGSDLTAQERALNTVQSGAQKRYADYLAKLSGANTAAQGNINTATQTLLASIPQQAQANPVLFQQPAAMEQNVYSNYLRSLGMSAPEVANTQQFNSAQAQAANTLAQNTASARQAAQQQYLDNLRLTAQQAGTAATQRLASQVPAYEMQALSTLGSTEAKIADALQKARTGAATSRQTTLDALLPLLLKYPSASADVLKEFGLDTPAAATTPTSAATEIPKQPKLAPKNPKKDQVYTSPNKGVKFKYNGKYWEKI